MTSTRRFVVAVLVIAPSLAAQQSTLPPVPGGRVVTVTPEGKTGSEPSIAINRRNPAQVVVTAGAGLLAYSTDSARSFTTVNPAAGGGRTGGDPSLTFDDRGNAFFSYLWITKLGSAAYWGHGSGPNAVIVRRSADGGATWDRQETPISEFTEKDKVIKLADMPRIWADQNPKSPFHGNLYYAWIEWGLENSVVLFSRSTDQGKTWSSPMRISTVPGFPRDDNGSVVGIIGTVAPDGTQYIVWNQGLNITLAVSKDGGKTFAPSKKILDVGPPYFGGTGSIPGVSRTMGFPQVALDPRGQTLYVSWSDYSNGDVDVFLSRSTDRGRTWTKPQRVNDDPKHDGIDQFFQWMTVDPVSGDVYVQFYDRRADAGNRATRVTLARSTDGGKSFTNYDWSDKSFTGDNAFLGDYMWLVAHDRRVYGVWAEAPDGYVTVPARRPGSGSATIIRVGTADFRGVK
ncbi:MAG: sialidase family protein [Gemmatimonadaceae bacterium]